MKATALMCTYGRHYFVERSVRMFLEQDYENKHLVIFQNSSAGADWQSVPIQSRANSL